MGNRISANSFSSSTTTAHKDISLPFCSYTILLRVVRRWPTCPVDWYGQWQRVGMQIRTVIGMNHRIAIDVGRWS